MDVTTIPEKGVVLMTVNDREACLALLEALYGKADDALLKKVTQEIEDARVPTTDGWAAFVPYPVAQAWDKLDIPCKVVAYTIAVDEENSRDD